MKVNFSQQLKSFGRTPIVNRGITKDANGKDVAVEVPVLLRDVCVNALLGTTDERIDGAEKYARYKLANRIDTDKAVEVSVEELAKIKTLVGNSYDAIIVGAVYDVFEGMSSEETEEVPNDTSKKKKGA